MVKSPFTLMPRLILVFLVVSFGLTTFAPAEAPNIILITMDTTRADRMGFMGCKKGLTPIWTRWLARVWCLKKLIPRRR